MVFQKWTNFLRTKCVVFDFQKNYTITKLIKEKLAIKVSLNFINVNIFSDWRELKITLKIKYGFKYIQKSNCTRINI